MWNKHQIIENLKPAFRFFVQWLAGSIAFIFIALIVIAEWKQLTIQEATLAETHLVKQNQDILKKLDANGEAVKKVLQETKELLQTTKINAEVREDYSDEIRTKIKNLSDKILANQEALKKDRKEREARYEVLFQSIRDALKRGK